MPGRFIDNVSNIRLVCSPGAKKETGTLRPSAGGEEAGGDDPRAPLAVKAHQHRRHASTTALPDHGALAKEPMLDPGAGAERGVVAGVGAKTNGVNGGGARRRGR